MSLATIFLGQSANALKAHGAPATLTRITPGKQDVTTGAPTQGITDSSSTYAVLDASSTKRLGFVFSEGLIQKGDILAKIPAQGLDFEPLPGDVLTVRSIIYRVVDVRPDFYQATPVMFSLLVRK